MRYASIFSGVFCHRRSSDSSLLSELNNTRSQNINDDLMRSDSLDAHRKRVRLNGESNPLQFQIAKAGGVFSTFQTAAKTFFLAALGANFFALLFFLGPHGALEGETDLALFAVNAEDFHIDFLADFERFFVLLDLLVRNFGNV